MIRIILLTIYLLLFSQLSIAQHGGTLTCPSSGSSSCQGGEGGGGQGEQEECSFIIVSSNTDDDSGHGGANNNEGSSEGSSFEWSQACTEDFQKWWRDADRNTGRYMTQRRDAAGKYMSEARQNAQNYISNRVGALKGSVGDALDCISGCSSNNPSPAEVEAVKVQAYSGLYNDLNTVYNNAHSNFLAMAESGMRDEDWLFNDASDQYASFGEGFSQAISGAQAGLGSLAGLSPEEQVPSTYSYNTPYHSQGGQRLHRLSVKRDNAARLVSEYEGPQKQVKEGLIDAADDFLEMADDEFSSGDAEMGEHHASLADHALDAAVGLIPGVSLAHDIYQIMTGENYITGEPLSDIEKGILVGTLAMPSILSGSAKAVTKFASKLADFYDRSAFAKKAVKGLFGGESALGRMINRTPCGLTSIDDLRKPSILEKLLLIFENTAYANGPCDAAGEIVGDLIEPANKYGISHKGMKAYARIHDAVETLPSNLKPLRIRSGTDPEKIAIIGRSMGDRKKGLVGVNDAATHFGRKNIEVTTFSDNEAWEKFKQRVADYEFQTGNSRLPASVVIKTEMYKSNKAWAELIRNQGYTVVDLGDPNELYEFSAFYAIEKKVLFGGKN